MRDPDPITTADLYPQLSKEQQAEVESNLRQYLAALLCMAERLDAQGKSITDLAVDGSFDDQASPM